MKLSPSKNTTQGADDCPKPKFRARLAEYSATRWYSTSGKPRATSGVSSTLPSSTRITRRGGRLCSSTEPRHLAR